MLDHIPVFLASDNAFAPFVAVTIVSAMENTKSSVDFYVLDSGISEESKRKIKASSKKYPNCRLEFISIDEATFVDLPEGNSRITKAAYSRFLIPQLKPELKKVIYSDVDVLFLGDIKELYEETLDGEVIGVVHDAGFFNNHHLLNYLHRLNLPKNHRYFYSGMLLLDIEKWNGGSLTNKLIQLGIDNSERLTLADQDLLNMCFGSNYKLLSVKYEATNTYVLNADKFDETIRNDLHEIIIRHFEGEEKPWNSNTIIGKDMPHVKEFWRYAKRTDFYSVILKHRILSSIQKKLVFFLELFYCPI